MPHAHPDAPALRLDRLTKVYAGGVRALDEVSLESPRGSFFGLLGPNGAGKSTLIRTITGLVRATSGSAHIYGHDALRTPLRARQLTGLAPQEPNLDRFLTVRETLRYQAGYCGLPRAQALAKSDELLAAFDLEDKALVRTTRLSSGMKRRLLVAKAMVHSPPVLVLDEPTAGVDIELRKQLWNYVRSLNQQGVTVVLTTHYLEEAEQLCDRIAIINHGRVIANEPTQSLIARAQEKSVVVTFDRDIAQVPKNECFQNIVLVDERTLEITYRKDQVNAGEVLTALAADGLGIVDVKTREPDLEDVFLSLVSDDR